MKYLPVPAFDTVTSALNFNTPDCNVTGGCDLYTTKSTGSDKKLYKNINDDLDSQHAELLKLGASLSPPQKAAMMATSPSLFSQSSAFGPLSELSSRRTFAYLIATLNASHPHYDFSNVLAPGDFKRERSLRRLMANLDSILQNVRGSGDPGMADGPAGTTASTSWSQHCWSLIDKEMHLDECTMFNYRPDVDPFEDDESAIWSVHYFFFNRALKRVAYLYLRVVPVISTQSPTMVATALSGGRAAIGLGATKRARYWLSEHDAAIAETYDDEDEDDGFLWNRGEDGDLVQFSEDDYAGGDDFDASDDEMDLDQDRGPVRGVSEDIASRMEI